MPEQSMPATRREGFFGIDRLDAVALAERLREEHAFALPVLAGGVCEALLAEADTVGWRPARALVGKPPDEVVQAMEICTGLPAGGMFHGLADAWQALWNAALSAVPEDIFEGRLDFNDRVLQRYAPVPVGISPHRDRNGYRNLVCLFVLCGEGRFGICADRAGNRSRVIPAAAGDVLLMRAPGFLGERLRPFHFVDRIRSPRYVFGLRHEPLPGQRPA